MNHSPRVDYGSGVSEGAIEPDGLLVRQDPQWIEHRAKLERALASDAPILELLIQSSATLIKGEKIQVNAEEAQTIKLKLVESYFEESTSP